MGSAIFRNRFWYYRSLYDDYCGREMRLSYGIAAIIWIPHYLWGVHFNREMEVNAAHKNYALEYGPRRLRLTHSMLFEEFEVILEKWEQLEQEYKDKELDILKFNGVKSVENEGMNLQMNQAVQFPISQDIDVGMDTQIFQQNRFANFYITPRLGYNVNKKTRLDMKYTFGDSNKIQLQLCRVLNDSIIYGFSYMNYLKRFKCKDDSFMLFLQKHRILNQNDRLYGYISLGSSTQLGCEYKMVRNRLKFRTMNSVQVDDGINRIGYKQEYDVVYRIDDDHKLMAQVFNQSQFKRVRVDLVKKLTDSLKAFVQIDHMNANNLVLYLGLKYKKTDLMLPVYWSQKGHILQKDNWKALGFVAVIVSLFDNLHKQYKKKQKKEEKNGRSEDKKYNESDIPLSMKLKQIERRALENHNQQKAQGGLVILEAYYGCKEILKELEKQTNKTQYLYRTKVMRTNKLQDITMALRFWIYRGRLELLESSKEYLYGVGDGMDQQIEQKGVLIKYVYQNREYQELYDDKDKVSIPRVM